MSKKKNNARDKNKAAIRNSKYLFDLYMTKKFLNITFIQGKALKCLMFKKL